MATTITRTPMVDDDGTGRTGTIINNAWKQEFYGQIDAALAALSAWPGGVAGQIGFPAVQVPSPGANVLDDYEEGTFTPTFVGSGGQSGQTYALQLGYYVKVGSLVSIAYGVALSVKGTFTGALSLANLPFQSHPSLYFGLTLGRWGGVTPAIAGLLLWGQTGSTLANLFTIPVTGAVDAGSAPLTGSLLTNDFYVYGSGCYHTPF